MRNTINEEKVASRLDEAAKTTIETKISETIAWLDANQNSEKEEYEEKKKKVEAVCNPIIRNIVAGAGGMPDMGDAVPKIEEID
ncbi:unnamed protein product [Ectocarpus fasciculatus]